MLSAERAGGAERALEVARRFELEGNLDVAFRSGLPAERIHEAIGRIETALKGAYPEIGRVYIEVDSLTDAQGVAQV